MLFSFIFRQDDRLGSVGGAHDCRAGGHGFDSRDRTNTLDLEIKWRYCLCPAFVGYTFAWLGWLRKMARDVKHCVVLNALTLKWSASASKTLVYPQRDIYCSRMHQLISIFLYVSTFRIFDVQFFCSVLVQPKGISLSLLLGVEDSLPSRGVAF